MCRTINRRALNRRALNSGWRFCLSIAIVLLLAASVSPAWTCNLESSKPWQGQKIAQGGVRTVVQSVGEEAEHTPDDLLKAAPVPGPSVEINDKNKNKDDEERDDKERPDENIDDKNEDQDRDGDTLEMTASGEEIQRESNSATPVASPAQSRHRAFAAAAPNQVPCFCVIHLTLNPALDQKTIWASPLRLPAADRYWLVPAALGAFGLVSADNTIMRHFGSTPLGHSNSFSNYGLAGMIGSAASIYFSGVMTHDDHGRESGLLAGEAAVNSVIVAEALKAAFERPRPNATNGGSFGAGGASFPSEHAIAAWSIATVIAHEYPGPLTKLLAYGAASGISDSLDVLKAVLTGSFTFLLIIRYGLQLKAFPLSIYALEGLISFTLLTGVRVLSRMLAETVRSGPASKRLLLVGAGHAAQMIIRETQGEMRREKDAAEKENRDVESEYDNIRYQVIGCVDDDPLKKGLRLLGVPVFGPVEELGKFVVKEQIDEVLIAIPSATPVEMRRLASICKESGTAFEPSPRWRSL